VYFNSYSVAVTSSSVLASCFDMTGWLFHRVLSFFRFSSTSWPLSPIWPFGHAAASIPLCICSLHQSFIRSHGRWLLVLAVPLAVAEVVVGFLRSSASCGPRSLAVIRSLVVGSLVVGSLVVAYRRGRLSLWSLVAGLTFVTGLRLR